MSDPVFFAPSREFTVGEMAGICGATLTDPSLSRLVVAGAAAASDGGPGMLIFIDGKRNARMLADARATAVLCQAEIASQVPGGIAVLATPSPLLAFARALTAIYPDAARPRPVTGGSGVSPAAHVDPAAFVEEGAVVEPGAVIGRGAAIGRGAVVGPGAVIGPGCQIGRDSHVGAGASIAFALVGNRVVINAGARIGQEGFRFVPSGGRLEKVPQVGRVIIQDDVEIGANTTIDRGGLGDTVIGEGTKIDNLVQIGHNVRIGRCCAIAAHVGVSGSVTIGDHVMLGGRAGIADHVTIGDRAQIVASSGVMHDVPAGQKWAGTPAQPAAGFFREVNTLRKLTERKGAKGDGA